ncbi:MAG TPA: magnesium transporter [Steroidobacteraceae bacterium]|nr:magnesium transporter [Steroidobacteraceae bacterium]
MSGDLRAAIHALDRRFLLDHPQQAAREVEELEPDAVATEIEEQPLYVLLPLFRRLVPPNAAQVLIHLPEELAAQVLTELLPTEAMHILNALDDEVQSRLLERLEHSIRDELRALMSYPQDSAGRLMDTRIEMFRTRMTVGRALEALRRDRARAARSLFLVDDDNKLVAWAAIQDVAVAEPEEPLAKLAQPVVASVHPLMPREEVVALFETPGITDLPVVDVEGRLIGMIHQRRLVQAMQEDLSADIQMMSGASPDERALSTPWFAVRKRLPWLQINLLTAFLAAAVVGLFESTIARFTALAVLLPVVAGQSGNSGAQALAVTMRGLVLREITPRQWPAVTVKEASAGLINGLAIAVTCGLGVYLWSRSVGLVLVIMLSMVLAMVVAGLAGAIVPIVLRRFGQDPAQSSSIILTTVTDVAGFFSFLGIATWLSGLLGP